MSKTKRKKPAYAKQPLPDNIECYLGNIHEPFIRGYYGYGMALSESFNPARDECDWRDVPRNGIIILTGRGLYHLGRIESEGNLGGGVMPDIADFVSPKTAQIINREIFNIIDLLEFNKPLGPEQKLYVFYRVQRILCEVYVPHDKIE